MGGIFLTQLRPGIHVVKEGELRYLSDSGSRRVRFKPWLGDSFSFLYDFIMSKFVFPRKIDGDMQEHYRILSRTLADLREKHVLELGTGSGSVVHFLHKDNLYTGVDVSPGLLKKAAKKLNEAGFVHAEFFVASAENLPFENGVFDVCLSVLSLNFFGDIENVLQEVSRVLAPHGSFVCCVPVPEKNRCQSTIRGTLLTEAELERLCRQSGFDYELIPCENGALLYFKAVKRS